MDEPSPLCQNLGMGRAGSALRQVLETYGISQNKLAVTMGTDRANVNRWVKELRDPAGDVIFQIKEALRQISPDAADEFVRSYLGDTPQKSL
ncbi:MAG: helix-turn-helix transcriptional regulator [Nodosilinea sp.]